jgi:hypothetical protein
MTEVLGRAINSQLQKLRGVIESHNKQGDVYGLFAHHILKDFPGGIIEWNVICDSEWVEKVFDETNVHHIACIGYSLSNGPVNSGAKERFVKAFDLLKKREPFKGTHVSFPYQCSTFLGIILGVKAITDESWKKAALGWLDWVLEERMKQGQISNFLDLFYKYIAHQLSERPIAIRDISPYTSIGENSFLGYAMIRNIFQTTNQAENLKSLRKNTLRQLIEAGMESVTGEKAVLIFAAVEESIARDIENLLISPHFVAAVLLRFEDAMKRWRYDPDDRTQSVRWPVNIEREVQDILWLILRSYFDDLVDEETLPKVGHSSYKPDFAIPSLRLLVEAKVVYKKEDFKKIEKEIMEDSVGYLLNTEGYDKIIVFVYDKSASVQEHNTTRNALIKITEIEDVIIASKPSQLP